MRKHRIQGLGPALSVLTVIGLLVVGVWVYRAPLVEGLLRDLLTAKGIPVSKIEVTALSPWRAEFGNIRLADYASLQRVEAEVEWPGMFSPRLARLGVTGLRLDLSTTESGLNWRDLAPFIKRNEGGDLQLSAERLADLPEIDIRDASAKISASHGPVIAHLTGASLSLVPRRERKVEEIEAKAKFSADVKIELNFPNLLAGGWDMKDSALRIAGRIEIRNGEHHYRPESCDRMSVNALRKDSIYVSGPVSACLRPGGQGPAVAIDRAGRVALDVVAKTESAPFKLNIAALPSVRAETDRASLSLRLVKLANGRFTGETVLRGLDLVMPVIGLALEGVGFSAMTRAAQEVQDTWSFEFDAQALRHRAAVPAILPLRIDGAGNWAPKALVVEAKLQQSTPGLAGAVRLRRDNYSGEGEAEFDIPLLEFREKGFGVADLSPLLAQYVSHLSGGVQASGKIYFNDAWATPVEIEGSLRKLVVGINPSLLPPAMGELAADFGQSQFKMSLPPASPQLGRANVNIIDGGLQLDSAHVKGLNSDITFDSFWPPICQRGQKPSVAEIDPKEAVAMIVACLQAAFSHTKSEPPVAPFHDALATLHRYFAGASNLP